MQIYYYKGRTTKIDTAKGLIEATIKLLKFLAIALPIILLLAWGLDRLTGSWYTQNYCPRIQDKQLKLETHC